MSISELEKSATIKIKDGHRKKAPINAVELRRSIRYHLRYSLAKHHDNVSAEDMFTAVAMSIRDQLIDKMLNTEARYQSRNVKKVHYLSMEFLIGRSLGNNLFNLNIFELVKSTLEKMNIDIEDLRDFEKDAALGNGGLGRLAACFLDSMATMNLPAYGYGINYEYGLFKQKIVNGHQKEIPDHWLSQGSPWQIKRADRACLIPVYGHIENIPGPDGKYNPVWLGWRLLIGVPYDMPIAGYGGNSVNVLRLFSATSSDEFDMEIFNSGDYINAVEQKILSETVSKVLYPSDTIESGKELRLIQEYFMVACALRDIVRTHLQANPDLENFSAKNILQLNDTHPALAVAELMRMLIDEHNYDWDKAWQTTTDALAYTNHTLLPEALEKWSVSLIERVLPRHMQIIYQINHRFLESLTGLAQDDGDFKRQVSIIEEGHNRQVRMAYLSIVGSKSVNGVAALHSQLIKSRLVPEFYKIWPEKFNNKTNGITQRRWLLKSNPGLSNLISDHIGDDWITDLSHLRKLEPLAESTDFQQAFMQIKLANKQRLAGIIKSVTSTSVDPHSLFDIQIKRIHEYKRQLLNVMQIIHQYFSIVEDGKDLAVPRTYIFAGKAAPGYWAAKQIIKLINNVAKVVNHDPRVGDQLKVVFLPDYRVSLAEKIFPAADISEQVSTAGKEASGTGNMKFALNGALTIGTLDGANIEIREEVGEDNIFIFGLTADEILRHRQEGSYHPWHYYDNVPEIRRIVDAFQSDIFSEKESGIFHWIFDNLLRHGDTYFHLADLSDYISTQELVSKAFLDQSGWAKKAILNVARIGKFSSDRTIAEYARDIWEIQPVI